ncbi:hypothetical protein BUALT_Bualt13G0079000 [Buddleja alternifolia]|uniref:E3 SUMO-protein ligase SIZ1 n=1 Tax=Buddleja alternifolia TaxID=168488 RepID=A0AAV6WKW5_9LAMI|nr:hypothetical protein BUALT_Bualt13G0079000 [Buddleja alternifolia]
MFEDRQDKLAYFRIKELKDILTQLGLSKQGKKQDLVDRILAIVSDEQGMWAKKNAIGKDQVAKLVNDTYRKMQVSGAADLASKSQGMASKSQGLASKSQGISDSTNIKLKEEIVDSYQTDKIRCLCGSTLPTESMIRCEDPRCNVWQHIACVVIPEKPMEGILPNPPEIFYCEICRLSRADPFWVTVSHPLYPVKLNITNVPADGSNPGQSIEKTFHLTRADKDFLSKPEYDVQAWCMLVNDKVTFRMQWPQYADLQVNGVPVRAINRPGSQLLGANGRDDGPVITPCTRDGINKISLTGCDARIFCAGVRIVKRRTLHQILNMIPKESEGEHFEDALARVRRCVGGGDATENADSDSDIEVVADFIPVNLRCPMSGLRMKMAGRFKPCAHMGCFDLEVFVEMNQRSRKALAMSYLSEELFLGEDHHRSVFQSNYVKGFCNSGEDVAEIEVKPDGSWRAKPEGSDRRALGELGLWHLPDGSISASQDAESKPKPELKPIKQEDGSDSHAALKLGIKKNQNGCWEFNKSVNRSQQNCEDNNQNIIPMSSSATGSGRDGEDVSVNQDGAGNLDFSAVNGIEYESISLNIHLPQGFNDRFTNAPAGNAEVIVLSDSEEEIEPLMPFGAVYKNDGPDSGGPFPAQQHEILDSFFENPSLGNGVSSSLGLYNPTDEFGSNIWSSLPSGSQGVPSFQLFGSDADVTEPLVEMHHGSINCSSSINGYTLTTDTPTGPAALVPECTTHRSNVSDGLVDNHLAFSGNDPSLQIFLPTRPSDVSAVQSDLREHPDVVSNGIRNEDWITLSLGGGGGGGQGEQAAANGLRSGQELQPKDGALNSLAEHASLLLRMNDNRSGKTTRERSDSPFQFPRQRRSVRPRLFLSIDSDSE